MIKIIDKIFLGKKERKTKWETILKKKYYRDGHLRLFPTRMPEKQR